MRFSKRFWWVFAITQLLGELLYHAWPLLPDRLQIAGWSTSVVVLFPGNFLVFPVERLLWNRSLSLQQIALIEMPFEILINACCWMLCVAIVRVAFARKSSNAA